MSSDMYSCARCGKFRHELDMYGISSGLLCKQCACTGTEDIKLETISIPERGRVTLTIDPTDPDNSHYKEGDIEPWQYITANDLNFFEGNVVKYVTRWRKKNGLDDLRKARVYIDELIRQEEAKATAKPS